MKIRCETCAAKYSIADDKVRGRSVKLRCKRCQTLIVVRGEALTAAPAPAPADPLTGARNESSVLFSIANLQALASRRTESQPIIECARPTATAETAEPSGLLDIQRLAASLAVPASTREPERIDALLTVGAPLGSPLRAPVVVPPTPPSRRLPALLGAGVAGFTLLVAAVVISVVVAQPSSGGSVALAEDIVAPDQVPELRIEPAPEPSPMLESSPTREATLEPEAEPTPLVAAAEPVAHRVAPRADRPRAPRPVREPRAEREPTEGERSIERLMAETLGETETPGERRTPAREHRPETPTRAHVTRAMSAVAAPVRACGEGAHGLVPVSITFRGQTGRVASVQVEGGSLPPAARSCVARAARRAEVPPFTQSRFVVRYPFRL